MNAWLLDAVDAWWHWMLPMTWQLFLLAVIVAALDRIQRQWSRPQLLYGLWCVVLVKLVVPPDLSLPWSLGRLFPFESAPAAATATARSTGETAQATISVLAAAWLVGMLFCVVAIGWRWRGLRRWSIGGDRAGDSLKTLAQTLAEQAGMTRVPALIVHPLATTPFVWGVFRPVIVLPEWFSRIPGQQQRHALMHELLHIKRRDAFRDLIGLVLQCVYWFHPGVWYARRRLALLREVCCDQEAARILGERDEYRRTLLTLAKPMLQSPAAGSPAFLRGRSHLVQRVLWLQRPDGDRPGRQRALALLIVAAVAVGCVPMAAPATPPGIRERAFLAERRAAGDNLRADVANQARAPAAASSPRLEDLEGCLRTRYVIFGLMADKNSSPPRK